MSEAENNLIIENQFLLAVVADRDKRIAALLEVCESRHHDSWRCGYYAECHCGLNEAEAKAGLELSPCGYDRKNEGAGGWIGGGKPQDGTTPAAATEKDTP